MKGETVDEITGFAKAMREASIKVSPPQGRIGGYLWNGW